MRCVWCDVEQAVYAVYVMYVMYGMCGCVCAHVCGVCLSIEMRISVTFVREIGAESW